MSSQRPAWMVGFASGILFFGSKLHNQYSRVSSRGSVRIDQAIEYEVAQRDQLVTELNRVERARDPVRKVDRGSVRAGVEVEEFVRCRGR